MHKSFHSRARAVMKIIRLYYDRQSQYIILSQTQAWADVLNYENWEKIVRISLQNCQICDNNIKTISDLNWPNLCELDLNSNNITDRGVQILTQNQFPRLKRIYLNRNIIKNLGLQIIFRKFLPQLQILEIVQNYINYLGLKPMLQHSSSNLLQLVFSGNHIGSLGAKILIKAQLPKLQKLILEKCSIENEGCNHLSKGKWPQLRHLLISGNYLSLSSGQILSNCWKKLDIIDVFFQNAIIGMFLPRLVQDECTSYDVVNPFIKTLMKRLFKNVHRVLMTRGRNK